MLHFETKFTGKRALKYSWDWANFNSL